MFFNVDSLNSLNNWCGLLCDLCDDVGQTMYYLVGLQAPHLTSRSHPTRNWQSGYKLNLLQDWCALNHFHLLLEAAYLKTSVFSILTAF